jgi:hypothetical protein
MNAKACLIAAALLLQPAAVAVQAQQAASTATASLEPFDWLDGIWRGEAQVLTQAGRLTMIQTERSGEMLGGTIRIVEGKGYTLEGTPDFNAFGIISAKAGGGYEMRSWARGQTGTFELAVTDGRVVWEIPAGPATIRYEAWLEDGKWVEVGHRLVPGQPPMEILRMELTRIGDTDWPAAGVPGPR